MIAPMLRPRRVMAVLALTLLAACSDPETRYDVRPADTQPAAEIALRFAWSAPSSARVREQIQRGGQVFDTAYDLHVTSVGEELVVRCSGLELVRVDGRPLRDGTDRATYESMRTTMAMAMPPLRVDRSGAYLGVFEFEAWQNEMADALEELRDQVPDDRARAQLRGAITLIRSGGNRPLIEQSAGDRWETWVGVWRGLKASPGTAGQLETCAFLPWSGFGDDVELPYTFVGLVRDPADHVRLELDGEISPADTGNALTRAMSSALLGDVENMRVRLSRVAVLDPTTMRPVHAQYQRRVTNDTEEGRRQAVEVRTWTFDWHADQQMPR